MKKLVAALSLVIAGCASAPLTAEEQAVRIYRKSDPPAACRELAKVHAPGMMAASEQGREDNLRRAARAAGGNVVTYDRIDDVNTVFGTAYLCP